MKDQTHAERGRKNSESLTLSPKNNFDGVHVSFFSWPSEPVFFSFCFMVCKPLLDFDNLMDWGSVLDEFDSLPWESCTDIWMQKISSDSKIFFTIQPPIYADEIPISTCGNQVHTGTVYLQRLGLTCTWFS
jgi:hypothetical protein